MNTKVSMSILAALALVGCATEPSSTYSSSGYPGTYRSYSNGTVDRIEVVRRGDNNNVAGTVIGGVVGGLIGSQIGSGRGQTAATVAGAIGGAVAGHEIEKRRRANDETFRIGVRMDDGSYRVLTQDNITDLQTGDRVRVENNAVYRS